MKPTHTPVLVEEVRKLLQPNAGELYFDGTAGWGGHAEAIGTLAGRMILSDRDSESIAALKERFGGRAEIWHLDLVGAAKRLEEMEIHPDIVLLDLGLSSPQLDQPERGFSFNQQGPIDMRMDRSQSLTGERVVNDYSESQLADLIGRLGEEHRAKTVARAIAAARPITTTTELADVVRSVTGGGAIDPATRTFQAIRMEVNQELAQLEEALPILTNQLATSGRIAVISFHSLEDRIVKRWFDRESRNCICPPAQPVCTCDHQATLAKLTRRPISGQLDSHNPRARSAKLRAAVKLNKNQKEANEGSSS